jgi:IS1 family transposase
MSEKRVNDQTCLLIQDLMANWERQIDEMLSMVKAQDRYSSALSAVLADLHRQVCRVHRSAGIEMER